MIEMDYPRPHMYRSHWRKLDGAWEFDFFDDYLITHPQERIHAELHSHIQVPFTYQCADSKLSIHENTYHPCMIYKKRIILTDSERKNRLLLHFGAVDYYSRIWIDDTCIGVHAGGYTPFSFEITQWAVKKEFTITVEAIDSLNPEQPRGKQTWGEPFSCWYPPSSGIWQTVWLESVPKVYISRCTAEPESRNPEHSSGVNRIAVDLNLDGNSENGILVMSIYFKEEKIQEKNYSCHSRHERIVSDPIDNIQYWDFDSPHLYRLVITYMPQNSFMDHDQTGENLAGDEILVDRIETYTAFRTVEWNNEGFAINGKNRKMRLVLNQGYWPESGYTPPHPSAFKDDIKLMKQMGFNGCRMHMKFEDPRFYYWADRIGFYVWEEAPAFYEFSEKSKEVFTEQFLKIIQRDSMHPSVISWVICNESWGIRDIKKDRHMQEWLHSVIIAVKEADPSRPIIDNDGWEHLPNQIMTFHSYEHNPVKLLEDWGRVRENKPGGILQKSLCIDGSIPKTEPMMLTEFGGISFIDKKDNQYNWGYGENIEDPSIFFEKVKRMIETAESLPQSAGWCYTQFCDVHAEKNGLVFADRTPKFEIRWLNDILKNYE